MHHIVSYWKRQRKKPALQLALKTLMYQLNLRAVALISHYLLIIMKLEPVLVWLRGVKFR